MRNAIIAAALAALSIAASAGDMTLTTPDGQKIDVKDAVGTEFRPPVTVVILTGPEQRNALGILERARQEVVCKPQWDCKQLAWEWGRVIRGSLKH